MNLLPYYQAVWDLETDSPMGHEVTIKAIHNAQTVDATSILKHAVRSGTIAALDGQIFDLALSRYDWSSGLLFLNVHPYTLTTKQLVFPEKTLFSNVVLEITEGSRIALPDNELREYLAPFRAKGMKLAIDDYGTGWSNLRRVADLEPDYIKLDYKLARDISYNPKIQRLVSGMVSFALSNRVDLIIEGVETPLQAAAISALGVRYAQGFHFHRPSLSYYTDTAKQVLITTDIRD